MTNPTYDALYFIRFFAPIPEDRWCVGRVHDNQGRSCALGHCDNYIGPESWALTDVLNNADNINDGDDPRYPQSTPKRRILAALRDVACAQLTGEAE